MTTTMVSDMETATDVQAQLEQQLRMAFPRVPLHYFVVTVVDDQTVYRMDTANIDDFETARWAADEQLDRWCTLLVRSDDTGWAGIYVHEGRHYAARCIIGSEAIHED